MEVKTVEDNALKKLAVGRRPFNDPFFEEGDSVCGFFKRLCVYDIDEEELCHQVSKEFNCEVPGCTHRFSSVMEFEMHYNTLHRYVCSLCHKVLPSPHFLDLHIEENHDSYFSLQAERKAMYQCLVEDCATKFHSVGERKDHCIKVHFFPSNFRWLMPAGKARQGKKKSQPKHGNEVKNAEMEVEENSASKVTLNADVEDNTTELMEVTQGKPKTKQTKKHAKNETTMVLGQKDSCNNTDIQIGEKPPESNQSAQPKNAVVFKGFIPRNITANRTFSKKKSLSGKEWHQKNPSESSPSLLEGNTLSTDLKESLPVDMEDT